MRHGHWADHRPVLAGGYVRSRSPDAAREWFGDPAPDPPSTDTRQRGHDSGAIPSRPARVAVLLDEAEEQAYRLLVGLAGARIDQLADVVSLPVDDVADLMRRLEARGLVVGHGGLFRPQPPDVALGTALVRMQESLEGDRQLVAALSDEFRAVARRRDADHVVEVVIGASALRERLRDLQQSAREEILWFCRAHPLAMQGSENIEEREALARGVRYRAIYERALLEGPGELDSVLEGISWGEEARVAPSLPVRLAIVDRQTAICPLMHDDERDVGEPSAAIIGSGQLLDALLDLFEGHWSRATPLHGPGSDAEASPDGIGDTERLLLSLLVAGTPDKSIVTQLGISRRTVQRRIDRLMTVAGVDTRTALTYQAARRGWV